jgi:HD superfamily phosphohydrolase
VQKIINDPVHGFITLSDPLLFELLAHPWVQRLRRIKQMALAYLVYPGAVHTRLHHALGAYHLMCKAILELKLKGVAITDEEERGAKVAILLHDIGHGPFSHALEHSLVQVPHEEISLLMMRKLNEAFHGQLTTAIAIFEGTYPKKFLHQLVSSQLDMDRLDYLARDSFFTGVSEGVVGYDRIIKMMEVWNDQVVVEEKGIHSVENFLIARRLMYEQVYLHKTVMSSEIMLVKILERAKWLTKNKETLFATPSLDFFLRTEFHFADFEKDPACLLHYGDLDDSDLTTAIKQWRMHTDPILSDLCQRLLDRRLFKLRFESNPTLTETGIDDKHEKRFYFQIGSVELVTYAAGANNIVILFKSGEVKPIQDMPFTLITQELLVPIKKHYICGSI